MLRDGRARLRLRFVLRNGGSRGTRLGRKLAGAAQLLRTRVPGRLLDRRGAGPDVCAPHVHGGTEAKVKNWKTTLIGIAAGVLNLVANGATWKNAALSVLLGLFGASAKDHDVTGGSR